MILNLDNVKMAYFLSIMPYNSSFQTRLNKPCCYCRHSSEISKKAVHNLDYRIFQILDSAIRKASKFSGNRAFPFIAFQLRCKDSSTMKEQFCLENC